MSTINRPKVIARQKLEDAVVAAGSVAALAAQVGVQASTLRLLAAGGSEPKTETVRKLQQIGISAQDWLDAAPSQSGRVSKAPRRQRGWT